MCHRIHVWWPLKDTCAKHERHVRPTRYVTWWWKNTLIWRGKRKDTKIFRRNYFSVSLIFVFVLHRSKPLRWDWYDEYILFYMLTGSNGQLGLVWWHLPSNMMIHRVCKSYVWCSSYYFHTNMFQLLLAHKHLVSLQAHDKTLSSGRAGSGEQGGETDAGVNVECWECAMFARIRGRWAQCFNTILEPIASVSQRWLYPHISTYIHIYLYTYIYE
jgi:hypothetical protein